MASTVTVIDTSARRVQVKVNNSKLLREILETACAKFGLDPNQYVLKHGNKLLDMSLATSQVRLPAGAKLDLVQASRSAAPVAIALQLPTVQGNVRLTDKFPSTTTLWQILRRFESGVAGQATATAGRDLNITHRTSPGNGGPDAIYETPVVTFMSREYSSFSDFAKSLNQLGLSRGSTLLRLNYQTSDMTLKQAVQAMTEVFDVESETGQAVAPSRLPENTMPLGTSGAVEMSPQSDVIGPQDQLQSSFPTQPATTADPSAPESSLPSQENDLSETQGLQSSAVIFAAPRYSTPRATEETFADSDYEPTIEHAKAHQARLSVSGRNQRLASDAEIQEQERAKAERQAAVASVLVMIRLPDGSRIQCKVGRSDTAKGLYGLVRKHLKYGTEPFTLKYHNVNGTLATMPDADKRLIPDLGFTGRTLVNLFWADEAKQEARSEPALNAPAMQSARELPDWNMATETASAEADKHDGSKETKPAKPKGSKLDFEAKAKRLLGGLSKK